SYAGCVGIDQFRPLAETPGARVGQQPFVHASQAVNFAVLVRQQRSPVKRRLAQRPSEACSVLKRLAEFRRVNEKLLGDASDIYAGTAEISLLGDRHSGSVACRDAAGTHATRAGA